MQRMAYGGRPSGVWPVCYEHATVPLSWYPGCPGAETHSWVYERSCSVSFTTPNAWFCVSNRFSGRGGLPIW